MASQIGQVSPDGRYRWNGAQWVPVVAAAPVSADGRWSWNGVQWVPNPVPYLYARPFESPRFRAMFTMVLLALNAFALLVGMVFSFGLFANGGDLKSGGDTAVLAFGLLALAYLVLYYGSLIPTIVLFCMWLHRVVRNMPILGAPDPRWTPGQAVGRCFLPFLNLVHPLYSVIDAWRASDPSTLHAIQPIRLRRPVPPLIIGWWTAWLAGRILALISNPMTSSTDSGTVASGALVGVVANGVTMVAAGLAILVVFELTKRQDLKQELIESGRLA